LQSNKQVITTMVQSLRCFSKAANYWLKCCSDLCFSRTADIFSIFCCT